MARRLLLMPRVWGFPVLAANCTSAAMTERSTLSAIRWNIRTNKRSLASRTDKRKSIQLAFLISLSGLPTTNSLLLQLAFTVLSRVCDSDSHLDQGMIVLFHKMLDSEDEVQRNKALLALTRVRPLPPRAKELLLTPPSESARLRGLLETMTFAFDDSAILSTFIKYSR